MGSYFIGLGLGFGLLVGRDKVQKSKYKTTRLFADLKTPLRARNTFKILIHNHVALERGIDANGQKWSGLLTL